MLDSPDAITDSRVGRVWCACRQLFLLPPARPASPTLQPRSLARPPARHPHKPPSPSLSTEHDKTLLPEIQLTPMGCSDAPVSSLTHRLHHDIIIAEIFPLHHRHISGDIQWGQRAPLLHCRAANTQDSCRCLLLHSSVKEKSVALAPLTAQGHVCIIELTASLRLFL